MGKTKEDIMKRTEVVAGIAFICCALWGSAFPCVKIGYKLFQIQGKDVGAQMLFAGCRFVLAGILALFIACILNKKFVVPKTAMLPQIALLGFVQTTIQYVFFYIGLSHTTGVKASIITSLNVFFSILMAHFVYKNDKITLKKLLGCILGFGGVVLINMSSGDIGGGVSVIGEGFIAIAALSYAVASVYIKYLTKEGDTLVITGYQFLIGGVLLLLIGLLYGGRLPYISGEGLLMLLYLSFLSAVAFTLWGYLLKYNPVGRVAVFGFLNPVCGVLLSSLLLGEQAFTIEGMAALVLVCIGIFIVNRL